MFVHPSGKLQPVHSRIKRASRDSAETGTRASWVVASILSVAIFAAIAGALADGLPGFWLFVVQLLGGLLGPLAAWLTLFIFRLRHPISHWVCGMQSKDGIDYFSVETIHANAPPVGTIELRLKGEDRSATEWIAPERKTFVESAFTAYLTPYPADVLGPPNPGIYTISFRGKPWGKPPTLLTSGRYEYVQDDGWYGLRDPIES